MLMESSLEYYDRKVEEEQLAVGCSSLSCIYQQHIEILLHSTASFPNFLCELPDSFKEFTAESCGCALEPNLGQRSSFFMSSNTTTYPRTLMILHSHEREDMIEA